MEAKGDVILQKVVTEIFTPLYQVVVGIAFLYFLYGVAKFIYDMRNPSEKNTGKQHLLWGLVGLFIILSVGGILNVFGSIFGELGGN
jgi:hypothetical protein